jgi:hypothetical protein
VLAICRAAADGPRARNVMLLGDLLVAQGLATSADIELALRRQEDFGGRIGENLIAMGIITRKALDAALQMQYQLASALIAAEDLLARAERNSGMHHPLTYRHRSRLASALAACGRHAEALHHAQTALAGLEDSLGDEHAWTQDAAQAVVEALAALEAAAASAAADPAGLAEHPIAAAQV